MRCPNLFTVLFLLLFLSSGCTSCDESKEAEASKTPSSDKVEKKAERPRIVVLGFDGVEPRLLDRWMDEERLPNLSRLAETGHYSLLRTTTPPQSPVAWTTFATGRQPGEHGVFDFIRRNPANYLPQVATVRTDRPEVEQGQLVRPMQGENQRRGTSFWHRAGQAGVRGTVLFIPYSFPPDGAGGMRVVSGLGTPDVRGFNSTFHYFAADEFPGGRDAGPVSGGTFVKAERQEGSPLEFGAKVTGPTVTRDGKRDPVTIAARFAVDEERVRASHQGRKVDVDRGAWSPLERFDLEITEDVTYRAVGRYFPVANASDPLALYLGTLSADPRDPPFDVSYPASFAGELAEAIGRPFKTVGWVHETSGLSSEALDEAGFLEDMFDTMTAREEILLHVLGSGHDELTLAAFTATDRVSHMFWRFLDKDHPRYDAELDALYGNAIRDTYVRMDQIVGRVLEVIDDDTLLFVMSDHGFHGFNRGLNINRWLIDNGYMVLHDGIGVGRAYFRDVDWSRTRAYALGTGQLWLNMEGRESRGIVAPEDAKSLAEEIARKLDGLMDGDRPAVVAVEARENLYDGALLDEAPDLTVSFAPGYRTAWDSILGAAQKDLFEDNDRKWSGEHAANRAEDTPGILISNRKLGIEDPGIEDIAATVLSLYGVSHDLPGKVWVERGAH